jgi:Protein of unknown function (DUF2786)
VTSVAEVVRRILDRSLQYEDGLDRLTVASGPAVDAALAAALLRISARLFRAGWQPVELHRAVARRGEPVQARVVTDLVAAYLRGFDAKVDPRWLAQAAELKARVWWTSDDTYLTEAATRWRVDRVALLDAVLGLLAMLSRLPAIEVLVPPPGSVVPAAATHRIDGRLLERVRALLAKAESTDFPAEAEAYAGKAQELIARHSLEEAIADAATPEVVPYARRVGVDHPYEDEKAHLLDAVARANRCETVWSPELGFTTVFGFDADIDAVELLYTSLLVQANRAMARDEPAGGKAGRARLKTFRRSFLIAYAVRIGERLTAATAAALTEVGAIADLLPVLASREAQVRATVQRTFPNTVRVRGSRVDSAEGWESGRAAADQAALTS